jgi:hypothetical protein
MCADMTLDHDVVEIDIVYNNKVSELSSCVASLRVRQATLLSLLQGLPLMHPYTPQRPLPQRSRAGSMCCDGCAMTTVLMFGASVSRH